jgi:hypothetical protein
MATKKQALESRLGSWTDQANLTRSYPPETASPATDPASAASASRESYEVARSLIDRITDTANAHGLTHHEVVGHLLTWALDQVDAGHHTLPVGQQP